MPVKIMLKELRSAKGLSQNALARELEMSVNNIQKMEYQKAKSIPLETIERLCQVFNCEVGELLKIVPASEMEIGND
ncbi:MAG: helix-turn-helix domain-containing protein [Cyanobacteria bacterium CRU_2_1]|nr:helix-turn-helix domain-containing protein [Cyanobacteria bacterium CRU_2_1]